MGRRGRALGRDEVTAVLRRFTMLKRTWPADKVVRRDPDKVRQPSEVAIRLCSNVYCRHWTPTRLSHCPTCHVKQH